MATKKWQEENIDKIREYRRAWYRKNKQRQIAKQAERRKSMVEWYNDYKSSLCCCLCPENDPDCLDFHHRDADDKDIAVGLAIHNGWGRERILEEIAKCDVLCANCHRKLHGKINRGVM